jgi:hypothetical protein
MASSQPTGLRLSLALRNVRVVAGSLHAVQLGIILPPLSVFMRHYCLISNLLALYHSLWNLLGRRYGLRGDTLQPYLVE